MGANSKKKANNKSPGTMDQNNGGTIKGAKGNGTQNIQGEQVTASNLQHLQHQYVQNQVGPNVEFMQQSHGQSQQGLKESGANGGHGSLFVQPQANTQRNPQMHPFVYSNGMNNQYVGQQPAQCGQYANQS